MSEQRVIEVVADWVGLAGPTPMGYLTATAARGKEVFAFEYDTRWLSSAPRQQLEPSMALSGWALAPAYDMNPDPHGAGLKLNISETDNAQDIGLAMSVAAVFRVKKPRAQEIVTEVTNAVKQWRTAATAQGLPRSAQDRMRRAFRIAEAWAGG